MARQTRARLSIPTHYASADDPGLRPAPWLTSQWEVARQLARREKRAVLFLDEVQKLPEWSGLVKKLWDEDTDHQLDLQVVVLGSSRLLLQAGLSESLAGRFEVIHVPHWPFAEMRAAFGWSLDRYLYFGGYPGAASLVSDEARWSSYVLEALIETTIARDVLLMSRVTKPALLRRLFQLGCHYSGQILSYQKMMGQLQDAGNTTTLAHYLELLDAAGLLCGLEKFSLHAVRSRSSSPKWQVLDAALLAVQQRSPFKEALANPELRGRLVESTVGAHLVNQSRGSARRVFYWREGNFEVDFVLEDRGRIVALEVKSGREPRAVPGLQRFLKSFPQAKPLLVGAQGIPIEDFLMTEPNDWF